MFKVNRQGREVYPESFDYAQDNSPKGALVIKTKSPRKNSGTFCFNADRRSSDFFCAGIKNPARRDIGLIHSLSRIFTKLLPFHFSVSKKRRSIIHSPFSFKIIILYYVF